jgi:RNA methyltransferase, TrmH family
VLTSVKNPKVAATARLKKRAFREEDRRFLVEGRQGVAEALGCGRLLTLFAVDPFDEIVVRAAQARVDVNHVSDEVMGKLTSTVTPQGMVGVAPFVDAGLDALPADGCIAVLHEVRDPGNAGTVLRSADAAGAAAVVFSASSVDVYNPKTVRASAGSLFHIPIVRAQDAAVVAERLQSRGFRVLAMDAHRGADLYRTDLSGPVAYVFGNEAHGLSDAARTTADAVVSVPHAGRAESLNLAAAATVCLFEWARRRFEPDVTMEGIVAAAAHDIRSPLTAMKGFGYALGRRWDQLAEADRSMMLEGIVHDVDRTDQILRLLVDAARALGGQLEFVPEQVDVSDLVLTIQEELRRDPDHPAVEWGGDPTVVFVDPTRLKTSILVFLESLVWWGREGSIEVRARSGADELHVFVSRGGASIDAEEAERLFEPRRPGTGSGSKIGLFVVRRVAEAQGGSSWAEVRGDHLTFHLRLPIRRPIAP